MGLIGSISGKDNDLGVKRNSSGQMVSAPAD